MKCKINCNEIKEIKSVNDSTSLLVYLYLHFSLHFFFLSFPKWFLINLKPALAFCLTFFCVSGKVLREFHLIQLQIVTVSRDTTINSENACESKMGFSFILVGDDCPNQIHLLLGQMQCNFLLHLK